MTGYPRLTKMFDAIELALGNEQPKEECPYSPIFVVLHTGGNSWQFFGWHGDSFKAGPENGREIIDWCKTKPEYNSTKYTMEKMAWVVCRQRTPGDSEIPMSMTVQKPEPAKDEPRRMKRTERECPSPTFTSPKSHPKTAPFNTTRGNAIDIQRLRNLTTGLLHTKMEHIYQDIEFLTGAEGIFTHQIPNAFRAMEPWLKATVEEPRFWDGKFDQTHVGEYPIEPMGDGAKATFWARYGAMPSPLAGKEVLVAEVGT